MNAKFATVPFASRDLPPRIPTEGSLLHDTQVVLRNLSLAGITPLLYLAFEQSDCQEQSGIDTVLNGCSCIPCPQKASQQTDGRAAGHDWGPRVPRGLTLGPV